MADFSNQNLGNFRISGALGIGGMGTVYKAFDTRLSIPVAIKIMHPQFAQQQEFQQRFRQEARSAAAVKHLNIVGVRHFAQEGDQLYMVMDYVPGDNLRELINKLLGKREWLSLAESITLVETVCRAIGHAHQSNVIHRDLKPANIMLQPDDKSEFGYQPVITDLGLAKTMGVTGITHSDSIMGTPAYMSPEQVLGPNEAIGAASDIYSLGVLLYELVISKPPVEAKSITEIMRYYMAEPIVFPDPQTVRPELPDAIAEVIRKALQIEPNDRYASAEQMATALNLALKQELPTTLPESAAAKAGLATLHYESIIAQRNHEQTKPPQVNQNRANQVKQAGAIEPSAQDRIQIIAPSGIETLISVPMTTISVGREEDNALTLRNDPKMSRYHARIEQKDGLFYVTDLKSTNGVYIGDRLLDTGEKAAWYMSETLHIGYHSLRIIPAQLSGEPRADIDILEETNEHTAVYPPPLVEHAVDYAVDEPEGEAEYDAATPNKTPHNEVFMGQARFPVQHDQHRASRQIPTWVLALVTLAALATFGGFAFSLLRSNADEVLTPATPTANTAILIPATATETTAVNTVEVPTNTSEPATAEPTNVLDSATATTGSSVVSKYGIITSDSVNLRTDPGIQYSVRGLVSTGQNVRIIGQTQDQKWIRIEVQEKNGENMRGWVMSEFIDQ